MQLEPNFWLKFLPGRALFGIREVCSLPARAMAGASKISVAAKWVTFLAEEAPPDDERTNSERLGQPTKTRSEENGRARAFVDCGPHATDSPVGMNTQIQKGLGARG